MESSLWHFAPLAKKHDRSSFDCGNEELNQYLKKYARQNDKSGINRTFVAVKPDRPLSIDGYYSISSSIIDFESIPEDRRKRLPAYPIPAALIGRLAVDINSQGKGLGSELLVDALLRIVQISDEIGIYAIRVDAIDIKARQFYLKHEFIPFKDEDLSLFLPIKTIKQAFLIL